MPYVTTGERIGFKRGIREGESNFLAGRISRKLGVRKEKVLPLLYELNSDDLVELDEHLHGLESPESVFKWIETRKTERTDPLIKELIS